MKYKAIIWDFGGVITSSPFEAFNEFEEANSLPKDIIRTINSENPDMNAWAQFESNSITIGQFNDLFLKEAKAKGFDIKGRDIIKLLKGSIRENMVSFLRELKSDFKLGCITNNVKSSSQENTDNETEEVMSIFDHVIESSIVGIRKPNPKIYMMSCDALNVSPDQCIYLDDLGINLKPARELGMMTIKVIQPEDAIQEVRNLLK
tara:strand:- start:1655 stop:2269 length:615 start_codon:yes stop_codon:yes gene_type:complete